MELFPVGWANLSAQVEGLEDKLERDSKSKPVIVGMDRYQILSELTFYDPDQKDAVMEAAGSHLFGQRSLMFERWRTPQSVAGKNAVLVGLERSQLTSDSVRRHFASVTDTKEGTITDNGRAVRHFYYRIGYGYRPRENKD